MSTPKTKKSRASIRKIQQKIAKDLAAIEAGKGIFISDRQWKKYRELNSQNSKTGSRILSQKEVIETCKKLIK